MRYEGNLYTMPKAKYDDIYQDIKKKIETGTYPYAELLPSENTLITVYNSSRNTVRRALAGLIEEGYIQAIHGKGVRVIYQKIDRAPFALGGIESFQESARRNQFQVVTKVIQFSFVTVDEPLAKESGFSVGDEVYYIQRVRRLNGKPLILDTNVFLRSAVPGLSPDIAERSIYAYLEQKLGIQITTSKRIITVEHATEQDQQLLDLDGYNCLAVVSSQTFNSDGVMFEYTQSRHQPDYFSFYSTATRKKS